MKTAIQSGLGARGLISYGVAVLPKPIYRLDNKTVIIGNYSTNAHGPAVSALESYFLCSYGTTTEFKRRKLD